MLLEAGTLHQMVSPDVWWTFGKVVLIDLVLAGDNAIVIGMAAAGLPKAQRNKAILIGIGAATVMRILFATVAIQLLKLVGLALVGGFLLLMVCWKMWRELKQSHAQNDASSHKIAGTAKGKTMRQAATQIVLADISMSLDNVMAVAGAAREHPLVLIGGLVLSVALMGLAASLVAKILDRYRWITYLGLMIILYVALEMIYHGSGEMLSALK
jgi:YjbE family integral membrane protein